MRKIAIKARGADDKLSSVKRVLSDGSERQYTYKLFRVYREDGSVTTVSLGCEDYFRTLTGLKTTQRSMSDAMRRAARLLSARRQLDETETFSKQVVRKGLDILKAASLGVPLDEYEHSLANNSAWR